MLAGNPLTLIASKSRLKRDEALELGRDALLRPVWSVEDELIIAWLNSKGCLPRYETVLYSEFIKAPASTEGDFDARENHPMARRLTATQRRHLAEIVDDLFALFGLKSTHIQLLLDADRLARWIDELASDGLIELEEIFTREGGQAIRNAVEAAAKSPEVSVAFNLENQRATDYLRDCSRIIGRRATDAFRDQIAGALTESVEEGENIQQATKRIKEISPTIEPRAEMIARTETAFAHMEATRQGWEQSGVVVGKQFICAPDCCEWCQAVQAQYPQDMTLQLRQPLYRQGDVLAAQFTDSKGQPVIRRMTFDYEGLAASGGLLGPPIHPNCRCDLRPVLAEEFA